MPNAIFQLDESQILNDHEARLRRLETCNPLAVSGSGAIMTQIVAAAHGNITSPNTTTFTNLNLNSFTLSSPATVLAFTSFSVVSNTGVAPNSNYQYLGFRIDGTSGPGNYYTGAVPTVGSGQNPCFLMAVGHSLAPGLHGIYLDYAFDVAGNTTSTVGNVATYAFIIGG